MSRDIDNLSRSDSKGKRLRSRFEERLRNRNLDGKALKEVIRKREYRDSK